MEAGRRHRGRRGWGGATLLWDGVGVLMGGGGRLRRGGVSEGWAVGDRLSAQRAIQVLKSRWLVAGWRRGTDQPPHSLDHLCNPSSFSAKKKKSTHIQHTQAPSPQHQHPPPTQKHTFLHSSFKLHIQCPTHIQVHTHKLPQTHTHIHSQWNSGPLPSLHPQYIRYIFSNVPHARPCSWSPLAAHTHRHLHAEHGHTWSAPKRTRRPSHTKHALMLITQTLSCQTPTRCVHQAPTSRHSLPTPSHPHRQRQHHM